MTAWHELAATKAMVFMVGPRQSGKTTLARRIAADYANRDYLNWDIITDRTRLLRHPYFFETVERHDPSSPIIVFDEIHKYRHWKNYLKGVYDRGEVQRRRAQRLASETIVATGDDTLAAALREHPDAYLRGVRLRAALRRFRRFALS